MIKTLTLWCALLMMLSVTDALADSSRQQFAAAKIAIIIDDMGYDLEQGNRAVEFPGALTLAFIPHSPSSVRLAKLAHHHGKEILLHVPMSSENVRRLDKGGLTPLMVREEFVQVLTESLDSVPHIAGLNNHMGSELTQLATPMSWLMDELSVRQLFFIDSRTTPHTVAFNTALEMGIDSSKRDVFLDNDRNPEAIAQQYQKLLSIAHRRGYAIAIGHPYPETMKFLQQQSAHFFAQGVELVTVSQLLTKGHVTPNRI